MRSSFASHETLGLLRRWLEGLFGCLDDLGGLGLEAGDVGLAALHGIGGMQQLDELVFALVAREREKETEGDEKSEI